MVPDIKIVVSHGGKGSFHDQNRAQDSFWALYNVQLLTGVFT